MNASQHQGEGRSSVNAAIRHQPTGDQLGSSARSWVVGGVMRLLLGMLGMLLVVSPVLADEPILRLAELPLLP